MRSTSSLRPTMAVSGAKYRAAPVTTSTANRMALAQWTARSTRSKRSSSPGRSWSGRGTVLSAVRLAMASGGRWPMAVDPCIYRVAVLLPIAFLHHAGQGDGGQPFDRLVTEHPRDVKAHRATVAPADRPAEHRVGNDGAAP